MTIDPHRQDIAGLLGAHLDADGCSFGLWAPRANRVELALISSDGQQRTLDMSCHGGVWQIYVPGIKGSQRYGFRVHGQWAPDKGLRANPAKLLVDPYARAITAGIDYSGPILDHTWGSYYEPDLNDSAGCVPLSVTVDPSPAPDPIAARTPLADSVIYECHVKGMTQIHPQVPEHLRGTYAGLAYPAVVDYIKSLGVTALELLPVHHFASETFIVRRGMSNYWGYNSLGYFAPHSAYCSVGTLGEQVAEFKNMVSVYHRAGIEIILDVVYNHTCEGGHEGPTLCFRGIDHLGYYRLSGDERNDYDVTGCGNSLDTSQADVVHMIADSLRYWVTEMGVDGFRFDLATALIRDRQHQVDQSHDFKKILATDPVFRDIKMIAEPWDVGPYGYQVGNFGPGWSEWNDRYRSAIRDFWRGSGSLEELASRLNGSADIFAHDSRLPSASINFVTAHDGFTLRDLTTYNCKHNESNGESNRDGSDDNRSWNCGVEGETDDSAINALRHRQMRNMIATLLLSRGVPMICGGDELGRTQAGNNNAYCQDNLISWVDWASSFQFADVTDLVRRLVALRREHPLLRCNDFTYRREVTDTQGSLLGRFNLAWLNGYAGEMSNRDWHESSRSVLGMYISDEQEALLVWFHAGAQETSITMPPIPWGWSYQVLLSTGEDGELPTEPLAPGDVMTLPGRTVVVMQVAVPRSGSGGHPVPFKSVDTVRPIDPKA